MTAFIVALISYAAWGYMSQYGIVQGAMPTPLALALPIGFFFAFLDFCVKIKQLSSGE